MHIHRYVLVICCISWYSTAKHLPSFPAELKACMTSFYSFSRLQLLPDTVVSNNHAIVQVMKLIHHLKHVHVELSISFALGSTLVPFFPSKSCYSKEHLTFSLQYEIGWSRSLISLLI